MAYECVLCYMLCVCTGKVVHEEIKASRSTESRVTKDDNARKKAVQDFCATDAYKPPFLRERTNDFHNCLKRVQSTAIFTCLISSRLFSSSFVFAALLTMSCTKKKKEGFG